MLWRLLRPIYAPFLGPLFRLPRRTRKAALPLLGPLLRLPGRVCKSAARIKGRLAKRWVARNRAHLRWRPIRSGNTREFLAGRSILQEGYEAFAWAPVPLWNPDTFYPTGERAWLRTVVEFELASGGLAWFAPADVKRQNSCFMCGL